MKRILSDCDGVMLDWETHFHKWMSDKGYNRVVNGIYDLDIAYGIPRHEKRNFVREFNESAWMCCIAPFRDAESGVAKLHQLGYQFTVITSLSTDPYAKKLRQENLDTVFGSEPFEDLICLDTGADKDAALEPYRDSGLWWIEDKWENAVVGADMGLRSIIIDHAHNRDQYDPRIRRAADWAEVVKIIQEN